MHTTGKVIAFEVDTTRCETKHERLTGAEIKDIAKKPPANTLYLIESRDGHPFGREIGDTEIVHMHENQRFVTEPPIGKTS